MAVLEHLKQDVEDIRVCLLDFVQQDHRCGLRFTFSWLTASRARRPGGEPISFETECFSMYSDMSKRMSALSLPGNGQRRAVRFHRHRSVQGR